MSRAGRLACTGVAGAGLLLFGWLAWQAHASRHDLEHPRAHWRLGPSAEALNAAAEARLAGGLAALRDAERPIGARLEAYEAELQAAEGLLVRSLRVRPTQARALIRLAATRWELKGQRAAATASSPAMIDLASQMAPDVPQVQFDIGRLLLQMGRADAAGLTLARVVELDPGRSGAVVAELRRVQFGADAVLELLPPRDEVLVAAGPIFQAEERADDYCALLERRMDPENRSSLAALGGARLAAGRADALIAYLEGLGTRSASAAEAERLQQLALGYLAQSRKAEALASARRARDLFPRSGARAELLGDVAAAAEDHAAARAAYEGALTLWARDPGKPARRARIYRKIGETHEAEGRSDLAYDAFKMAIRLDRDERYSRRRVAEMEQAAGVGTRPGG